jgi:PilZ domain-containing protein
MATDDKDRRFELRVTGTKARVEYVIPLPHLRDLSISGFYIEDQRPFQLGQSLDLRIHLGEGKPIEATGMVRRVEPGQGMAIEFIHLNHDDRRRIKEYISKVDKPASSRRHE